MRNFLILIWALLFISSHLHSAPSSKAGIEIIPAADIQWQKLNPARGDKSPQAGTLWGDRKGVVATGFLVKFVDGFSSPPHIHNVSYRGIVIDGLIHNDDPRAAKMWMPVGSYWTQPAGEAHITAAKGNNNLAFIEIDAGPYLVQPQNDAFDNGERPFNIHASNIIWTGSERFQLAPLWKDANDQVTGTLIQLQDSVALESPNARVVVIAGEVKIDEQGIDPLQSGSLINISESGANFTCADNSGCLLYIKTTDGFTAN